MSAALFRSFGSAFKWMTWLKTWLVAWLTTIYFFTSCTLCQRVKGKVGGILKLIGMKFASFADKPTSGRLFTGRDTYKETSSMAFSLLVVIYDHLLFLIISSCSIFISIHRLMIRFNTLLFPIFLNILATNRMTARELCQNVTTVNGIEVAQVSYGCWSRGYR